MDRAIPSLGARAPARGLGLAGTLLLIGLTGPAWAQSVEESTLQARFEQAARLRDLGEPQQTIEFLEGTFGEPASNALVMIYADLLNERLGMRLALQTLETWEQLSPSPAWLMGRAILASTQQQFARADSLVVLRGEAGRESMLAVDALMYGLLRSATALQSRSSAGPANVDSLLAAGRSHPLTQQDTYAGNYMRIAYAAATAVQSLLSGQAQEGVQSLRQARQAAADHGMRYLELRYTISLMILATGGNDAQAGLELSEHALALAEQLGLNLYAALSRNYMALFLERLERHAEVRQVTADAAPIWRRFEHLTGLAWNRLSYGWSSWELAEVTDAIAALEEAYELFDQLGQLYGTGLALNNLGVVYSTTRRLEDGIAIHQRTLELARASGNRRLELRSTNNIGTGYRQMGRDEDALQWYQDALVIARELDVVEEIIRLLGNIGLSNANLGRKEQSIVFFEEAIRLAQEHGERGLEAGTRQNYALVLINEDQLDPAEAQLQRAVQLATEQLGWEVETSVRFQLGRLYERQGRHEAALKQLDASRDIEIKAGQARPNLPLEVARGMTLISLRRFDLAFAQINQLEKDAGEPSDPYFLTVAANLRAWALDESQRPDEALAACRQGMQRFISYRSTDAASMPGYTSQSRSLAITPGYHALENYLQIQRITQVGATGAQVVEAFEYLQHLKARSLLDRLQTGAYYLRPNVPENLRAQEEALRVKTERLRALYDAAPTETTALELAEAETDYQDARSRILEADARYGRASRGVVHDFDDIRSRLLEQPDTLILDFFVGAFGGSAAVFAVDRDGVVAFALPHAEALETQVSFYLGLLEHAPTHGDDLEALKSASEALGDALLGPVQSKIAAAHRVIFVPDGLLHRLPLGALRIRDNGDDDARHAYVAELCAVSSTPSLSVLLDLQRAQEQRRTDGAAVDMAVWLAPSADGVAGPSPSSGSSEADLLLDSFANTRVFPRQIATARGKQAMLDSQLLGRSRVVHLIAHGRFDDQRPWASGLDLDWTSPNDILRLEVADIYDMDFTSDLVTLSACETARGHAYTGEGMQGFAQSLFESGATSVLATLWRIDDASAVQFMSMFYGALADGATKAQALATAQRLFLTSDNQTLHHPYYWAPYVLLGEAKASVALRRRSPMGRLRWIPLIAAIALIVLAWRWRRSKPHARGNDASGTAQP